jgi:F-type H+-transporting ATPase subunit b
MNRVVCVMPGKVVSVMLVTLALFLFANVPAARATDMAAPAATEMPADAAHEPVTGEAEQGMAMEEHKGGLPQLNFATYPRQIFWLVIIFAVLFTFMSKKTLPEISGTLQKRVSHISSTIDAAKRQKETAEKLKQDYETGLENARIDAQDAFASVEKAIKDKSEKESKAFQDRASAEIERTEAEISKAKTAAMEDMQHLAAEIASKAAEKIIGVETDIDQAKTVVRSLKAKAA